MTKILSNVISILFKYEKSTDDNQLVTSGRAPARCKHKTNGVVMPISHRITASVRFEDGTTQVGEANCSLRDIYDKDRGRLIAVNRALGNGKLQSYVTIKEWFRTREAYMAYLKAGVDAEQAAEMAALV
ncbi:MAG: hypothetical protein CL811_12755 [Colwelliaceae bacterium]|nr:hypothetical protein [Colwelliaceae bacterium]